MKRREYLTYVQLNFTNTVMQVTGKAATNKRNPGRLFHALQVQYKLA